MFPSCIDRFGCQKNIYIFTVNITNIINLYIFTVNITNFNNYLIDVMKLQVFMVLWSVLKSPLVLAFCCNQSVYLHCELIGWFLHGAAFRLVGIFEQILVLEVLF